jgi:hypothetical protein
VGEPNPRTQGSRRRGEEEQLAKQKSIGAEKTPEGGGGLTRFERHKTKNHQKFDKHPKFEPGHTSCKNQFFIELNNSVLTPTEVTALPPSFDC